MKQGRIRIVAALETLGFHPKVATNGVDLIGVAFVFYDHAFDAAELRHREDVQCFRDVERHD